MLSVRKLIYFLIGRINVKYIIEEVWSDLKKNVISKLIKSTLNVELLYPCIGVFNSLEKYFHFNSFIGVNVSFFLI